MSETVVTLSERLYPLDDDGEYLDHVVCDCDEDTALCGEDVSGDPWIDDEDDCDCIVCGILDKFPCRVCGR